MEILYQKEEFFYFIKKVLNYHIKKIIMSSNQKFFVSDILFFKTLVKKFMLQVKNMKINQYTLS